MGCKQKDHQGGMGPRKHYDGVTKGRRAQVTDYFFLINFAKNRRVGTKGKEKKDYRNWTNELLEDYQPKVQEWVSCRLQPFSFRF